MTVRETLIGSAPSLRARTHALIDELACRVWGGPVETYYRALSDRGVARLVNDAVKRHRRTT